MRGRHAPPAQVSRGRRGAGREREAGRATDRAAHLRDDDLAHVRQVDHVVPRPTAQDQPAFRRLLADGEQWGAHLKYAVQEQPNGIAEALSIGAEFLAGDDVLLILGDNIFYGEGLQQHLNKAKIKLQEKRTGTIFAHEVDSPQRYGVAVYDAQGRPKAIEEKPKNPQSNFAITGLYCYPNLVVEQAKKLTPSTRGELEITDINNYLLEEGLLEVVPFKPGFTWLDTGTHESLLEAGQFIKTIEKRQGIKIGCLEEVAYQQKFIDKKQPAFEHFLVN